jgi:5-methyltetrahydrofolate--homocysteine methyltransferase
VSAAEKRGIRREDVIIDPLAMAVGVDTAAASVTLEVVRSVPTSLGVNTIVGGSNISFGLPERSLINRCFLSMAMAFGLRCAIVDPSDKELRKTVAACDLLMGRDEDAMRFLSRYRTGW